MERAEGPRVSRRSLIVAGALGVVAAGGTYAVARSGLVELPEVPGIPGLAGPAPDEIRSYGAWVRGAATSWHSSREAIEATSRVLAAAGSSEALADSRQAWQTFLVATMREA